MFSTRQQNDTLENARWIGFLPLYHAYGQLYSCMMSMLLATPVYVMSKFDFEEYLRVIQRYQITTLQLVPREYTFNGLRDFIFPLNS
jgi:4-coumarate--CoA ligase